MKKIMIHISFLLILLIALSGCTFNIGQFKYAGDKTPITVPRSNYTTLILDFNIAIGSITLEVTPSSDYLAYLTNEVSIREGSGKLLDDAEEISYIEIDSNTIKVQFDSNDDGIVVNYGYDIMIKLSTNISLQINFLTSTGSISIDLSDSSISINSLDVETSTGSISIQLNSIKFSDSTPKLISSTGNHDITLANLNYTSSTLWDISASTGNIDSSISALIAPLNIDLVQTFTIETSTGYITIDASLHQDYGVKIVASVSTGSITIPGGSETYTSTNFNLADQKYDFSLTTSTGSITYNSGG